MLSYAHTHMLHAKHKTQRRRCQKFHIIRPASPSEERVTINPVENGHVGYDANEWNSKCSTVDVSSCLDGEPTEINETTRDARSMFLARVSPSEMGSVL